jgi:putative membrane protein
MRKSGFLAGLILFVMFFFQACNIHRNNDDNASDDSTIVIKHGNPAIDTMSKDIRPKMVIPAEGGDTQFAVEAASSGMTEVELGEMAQKKGVDKRVKNFGAMMVKDHSRANNKLAELAKDKSILLPFNPLAVDQKTIDELKQKSGKDFDKAYINDMIEDHINDIKVFERASKNCQDPDLKAFAAKSLRALRNHLDAINTIHDSKE